MANDAEFYDELCIRRAEAYTNGSTTWHMLTQSESPFLMNTKKDLALVFRASYVASVPLPLRRHASCVVTMPLPL